MEMENESEREREEQLKDIFHEHQPLVFNEEHWDQSKKTICFACYRPLSGQSYSCTENCDFHLHKRCAEAPFKLNHHPLHSDCEHPFLDLQSLSHYSDCWLCEVGKNRIVYQCPCSFSLDVNRALFLLPSLGENSEIFKHEAHTHPLLLLQNHTDELKTRHCDFCEKSLVDSIYVCTELCYFYLHKKCAELPIKINHHPCFRNHIHPLILGSDLEYLSCKICQDKYYGFFYHCSSCKFNVDFKCAWPSLVIEDKTHHDHPFHLCYRRDIPVICEACGDEGNYISYICFVCHIQVHLKCASLPRIVKITRHNHLLIHNYFVQKKEFQEQDCKVCFNQVKTKYGSYYCLKDDCNYIVHVNCAIEDDDLYSIVDPKNQDEAGENSKLVEPSITSIIEVNECGDATKIKHISHQHYLILSDKVNEKGEDQHCDGCVRSISGLFYYCSECDFLLHKSCAELSRKLNFWFSSSLFILESNSIFTCDFCQAQCSGFAYTIEENSEKFCIKCANISHTPEHPSHDHLLFFNFISEGKCTACGDEIEYQFRCTKKCDFALDYRCITLPHAVQHKCDKHFLELSYGDKNDDPEQCYCDICEKQRDPNLWFYHCSICDTCNHPKCVLGKYPFIKIGSMWTYKYHPHPLTFVQMIYYYPQCVKCGQPCQDLSLECATCNYIVHWECISWWEMRNFPLEGH